MVLWLSPSVGSHSCFFAPFDYACAQSNGRKTFLFFYVLRVFLCPLREVPWPYKNVFEYPCARNHRKNSLGRECKRKSLTRKMQ